MSIRFYLEPYSQIPPHSQIIDRIKLALLTGQLRPGDTLPSIRDVEKELGISRNIVRRAYLELESYGILQLKQGKGVMVHRELTYPTDLSLSRRSQKLCQEILAKIRSAGLAGTPFARMLYQKALERERVHQQYFYVDITEPLAQERANQISRAWQITILGIAMNKLKGLADGSQEPPIKIFTNHWRYGEVTGLARGLKADIIPIGLKITQSIIEEFNQLKEGSIVDIVLDKHDFASYGGLILANYQRVETKRIVFKVSPFTSFGELKKRLTTGKCKMLLISNKLWDDVPAYLKRLKMVSHPKMEFDGHSSEQARLRAGIVI